MTGLSAEDRQGLLPLQRHLRRLRRDDAQSLRRVVERKKTKKVVRTLTRFLEGKSIAAEPPPKNPARANPSLVKHFVADEIWRAYEEVLAYETRMPASLDVIHKVRSSCRGLRYLLELFEGALPPGAADIVDALHALQDQLGDLHDHAVAAECIERWRTERELEDTKALTAYVHHRVSERDRLRRRVRRRVESDHRQRVPLRALAPRLGRDGKDASRRSREADRGGRNARCPQISRRLPPGGT